MIELMLSDTDVIAGQPLEGRIQIAPQGESVEFINLSLETGWHTEGRGDRASGEGNDQLWRPGVVEPMEPYEQTFALPIPPGGPISYRGELLEIHWEATASANIKGGGTETATADFQVLNAPVKQA